MGSGSTTQQKVPLRIYYEGSEPEALLKKEKNMETGSKFIYTDPQHSRGSFSSIPCDVSYLNLEQLPCSRLLT